MKEQSNIERGLSINDYDKTFFVEDECSTCCGSRLNAKASNEIKTKLQILKYLDKKGSIYVFDEPTQGLHLKDIEILKKAMRNMIGKGNSVIVIEHNLDFIIDSDYIIDMEPDAGKNGGKIVFKGYIDDLLKTDTYTAIALKKY